MITLLYTYYFTFSTSYVILSRIYTRKAHFHRDGIAPNVFPFHACRAYMYTNGTGPLSNTAKINHRIT